MWRDVRAQDWVRALLALLKWAAVCVGTGFASCPPAVGIGGVGVPKGDGLHTVWRHARALSSFMLAGDVESSDTKCGAVWRRAHRPRRRAMIRGDSLDVCGSA